MTEWRDTRKDGMDDTRLHAQVRVGSMLAAVITILVGASVLGGWAFDIRFLKCVIPGVVSMKANTAFSFVLTGAALLLLAMPSTSSRRTRAAMLLAMVVATIGGLTLCEYVFNWNIGIDELLFRDDSNPADTVARGRMAPTTAVSFVLLGVGLMTINLESRRRFGPRELLALTPLALGMFSLVEYALNSPILFGFGKYTRMAVHTAVVFMVLGVGLLAARPDRGLVAAVLRGSIRTVERWTYGALVIAMLLLLGVGGWFYREQEAVLRSTVESDLQTIATLKTDQIVQWRAGLLDYAEVVRGSSSAVRDAMTLFADPADKEASQRLNTWLTVIRDRGHFHSALLLDDACKVRLVVAPSGNAIGEHALNMVREAIRSKRSGLSDIHTNVVGIAHMDLVVPLTVPSGSDDLLTVGTVVLRADAERFLYPIVRSWPVSSHTAESLLVRREGDTALFLNPLHFNAGAAFSQRIPLSEKRVPVVQAVLGVEGVWYGTDYRGVDVVSVLKRVPDSPWFMVAKIDESEAFAVWRFRSVLIVMFVTTLMAVIIMAGGLVRRRLKEEHYRVERENMVAIMAASPVALLIVDKQKRIVFANPAVESLFGRTPASVEGQRCGDLIRCAGRSRDSRGCGQSPGCSVCPLNAAIENTFLTGRGARGREASFTVDSGSGASPRWVRFDVDAVKFDGRTHAIVALTDTSESRRLLEQADRARLALLGILEDQRLVEDRLRDSETMYRTLFDDAVDGIALAEFDTGRLVACNRALCRMVEREESELVGQHQSILHPSAQARVAGYTPTFTRHRDQSPAIVVEDELASKSGKVIPVEIKAAHTGMKGRKYIVGIFRDITERRRAEEEQRKMRAQLIQSQKLDSIGTLASGVAHEINNPIMGIMSYADLIAEKCDTGDARRGFAVEIGKLTDRVATIVKNLLTFARHDKEGRNPAQMRDIVDVTLSLIQTTMRHDDIRIVVDVPADLPAIRCRSQQIQQVLMNLLTNARDTLNEKRAVSDGDKVVTIVARVMEGDGRRWMRVTVEDNGPGIPLEIQERIFDPFFTTKARGKGTGLGLSISHNIAKDHGGTLTVESKPGEYARFHLDLPMDNG